MVMSEQDLGLDGCRTSSQEGVKTKTAGTTASNAWNINVNNGNINNNNNKSTALRVRCVSAPEQSLYDISFESLIEAFEDCNRHKRSSADFLRFSCVRDFMLPSLWDAIRTGTYEPDYSVVFIATYPVLREIIAAAYIDRGVHHWIGLRIEPLLESWFVENGNVSKNCRKGEGNIKAVQSLYDIIFKVSEGYTKDAWIFKGDIRSFFMSISKSLLWEMVELFIRERYQGEDKECLLYLLRVTIFHRPQEKCHRHSPLHMWRELPKDKSLFGSDPDRGIPIGNLPSQMFANFYASVFMNYIREVLGLKDSLNFCDDFCIVVPEKKMVTDAIPNIENYLHEQLLMELHPKKRYLQHYTKGVLFVGYFLKPGRIYISNRTVGNLYKKISSFNQLAQEGMADMYAEKFVQTLNSYYGMMKHCNSYGVRRKVARRIDGEWWKYIYVEGHFEKFVVKQEFKTRIIAKRMLRKERKAMAFIPEFFGESEQIFPQRLS